MAFNTLMVYSRVSQQFIFSGLDYIVITFVRKKMHPACLKEYKKIKRQKVKDNCKLCVNVN